MFSLTAKEMFLLSTPTAPLTNRDMIEPAIMAERLNIMMHGDLKRALLRFSTDGRASKIDD